MAAPGRPAAWRAFGAAFRFAWDGLVAGARSGRNLRVQLSLGTLAASLAALGPFAPAERALLLACAAAVIALESLNTALEAAVDLAAPGVDAGARLAKDAAAGAVLVAAVGAVLVLGELALPRAGELLAALGARAAGVVGAMVAAAAAGLLPWRARATRARDVQLAVAGVAGLLAVAVQAGSQAGTAGAAACLAVSLGAAFQVRPRVAGPGPDAGAHDPESGLRKL